METRVHKLRSLWKEYGNFGLGAFCLRGMNEAMILRAAVSYILVSHRDGH